MQEIIKVEPAGQKGWWIITYRDGIENRQAVTYDELKALFVALKEFKF